ncbi:hypothetical protein D3C81_423480 [compost metagenome]
MGAVEGLGQTDRQLAQFGLGRGQHGVAELEQATDLAAHRLRVQGDGAALGLQRQLQALGLVRVGHRGDLRCGGAHHQRLAAGGVDVHDAAVLDHRRAAGVAHQLRDQLIAAVQQVGRGVGDVGADGTIDLRDLRRQPVDLCGTGHQSVVDLAIEVVQVGVELAEAVGQRLATIEHVLPVGSAGRVGGQAADGVEEVRPDPGHVGGRVGEQRIDPVGHARELLQACQLAAAVEQARDRQLVGSAADVDDAGAVANVAVAVVLRGGGGEVDFLPAVTGRVEVGHVVAGGGQRTLEGEQGTGTGGKYAGHGVPQRRVIPSAAVAVLAKV